MKAQLQTIGGTTMTTEISTADSPMAIMRNYYQAEPTAATQLFANQTAIDQLMGGNVDEAQSSFELITVENNTIHCEWKTPLCDQPAVKEELANIEAEGQIPSFIVTVSSIVAAIRDYNLELAKLAGNIAAEVMGPDVIARTSYSSDGNSVVIEFDGYPFYKQREKGKVFVQFPRSTFSACKGMVKFNRIQQAQCKYYQEHIGKPLTHPHVYEDGHPCWDVGARERPVDFICNMIETFTLQNVTEASVFIGRCASGVMGVRDEGLANARRHQKTIMGALRCKSIVSDRRKLETYVNKRWCSMITILMKAA